MIAPDPSDAPLRVAVVTAGVRQARFGTAVARWALDRAERCDDVVVDAVDLRDHAIPADLRPSRAGERLAWPIGAADAVLVVTCEYNHGYPASLKLAIHAVREQWAATAVGFVSYGGLAGGLRAVEQPR
jgi:NAD(P)H-dependent FMN reductase